jgi:malonate transporter
MANAILLALAPVFFVLALGYGAGELRIVDNKQVDSLNSLVMDFALPASLFVATASAPRSEMFAQAPLFAILGGVMLAVYLAWYFLVLATSKVSKADASLEALTIAFPNMAGVALPIASELLGPTGTVQVAVALAAGSIIVSPLTLMLVELGTSKGGAAETPTARTLRHCGAR